MQLYASKKNNLIISLFQSVSPTTSVLLTSIFLDIVRGHGFREDPLSCCSLCKNMGTLFIIHSSIFEVQCIFAEVLFNCLLLNMANLNIREKKFRKAYLKVNCNVFTS